MVVKDVEKSAAFYSSAFGIGPFAIYEVVARPSLERRGTVEPQAQDGKGHVGQDRAGADRASRRDVGSPELSGDPRGGLHHLGFNVPNYDEVFKKFLEEGFRPFMRAESYVEGFKGHLKACSFDTRSVGGVLFEIIWKSWLMEG